MILFYSGGRGSCNYTDDPERIDPKAPVMFSYRYVVSRKDGVTPLTRLASWLRLKAGEATK